MGTTAVKIITSDDTELGMGLIADDGVLQRVGDEIRSTAGTRAVRVATATLDFGATPIDDGSVVVTGQSWVTTTSRIDAWVMRSTTADNTADEHEALATFGRFVVTDLVAGVGFTVQCNLTLGLATGGYSIQWEGV